MKFLISIAQGIDFLNRSIGQAMRWAILAAVLISAGNAVMRRLFSSSSNGWLEVQWYLFGVVFLFGSAYTLQRDEHVRIDFLSSRMAPRNFIKLTLFGHLFFLIPFCLVMIWLSLPWATASLLSGETSANPGGLPLWPAKIMVPAGFCLLFLQAVSESVKSLAKLNGALPIQKSMGEQGKGSAFSKSETGREVS